MSGRTVTLSELAKIRDAWGYTHHTVYGGTCDSDTCACPDRPHVSEGPWTDGPVGDDEDTHEHGESCDMADCIGRDCE